MRGDGHIEIVAPDEQVEAMRAHITHRRGEGRADLALDVDIPLLNVIPLRIRFNKRGGERAIPQRRGTTCSVRRSEVRVGTPRTVTRNAHFPWRSRSV